MATKHGGNEKTWTGGTLFARILGSAFMALALIVALLAFVPGCMGLAAYACADVRGQGSSDLGVAAPFDSTAAGAGDEIAYWCDGELAWGVVQVNHRVEGALQLESQLGSIEYADVVGTLLFRIPRAGSLAGVARSLGGQISLLCLFGCGIILWVIAGQNDECRSHARFARKFQESETYANHKATAS